MLFLVHHGEATAATVDPQRPLTAGGRTAVEKLALEAAGRGVKPAEIWHSGKLRARQTAEAFREACNPLAGFSMVRGLQPSDPPEWIAERLAAETRDQIETRHQTEARDLMLIGHMPHLPALLTRLVRAAEPLVFPPHGLVALEADEDGWRESWRLELSR